MMFLLNSESHKTYTDSSQLLNIHGPKCILFNNEIYTTNCFETRDIVLNMSGNPC